MKEGGYDVWIYLRISCESSHYTKFVTLIVLFETISGIIITEQPPFHCHGKMIGKNNQPRFIARAILQFLLECLIALSVVGTVCESV